MQFEQCSVITLITEAFEYYVSSESLKQRELETHVMQNKKRRCNYQ